MRRSQRYVNQPVQRRSRETLGRIVAATRELLNENVFEELSVQRIVRRAGCSVGTFYQRFPTKDAMLPYLLEIHYAEIEQRLTRVLAASEGSPLARRVAEIVEFFAATAVADRALIRTLVLRNLQRPESIPGDIRQAARTMLEAMYRHLLECRGEIRHHDPPRAVEVGLLMVSAAIRERLVLGATQAATLNIEASVFARELTAAFLAYLDNPNRTS